MVVWSCNPRIWHVNFVYLGFLGDLWMMEKGFGYFHQKKTGKTIGICKFHLFIVCMHISANIRIYIYTYTYIRIRTCFFEHVFLSICFYRSGIFCLLNKHPTENMIRHKTFWCLQLRWMAIAVNAWHMLLLLVQWIWPWRTCQKPTNFGEKLSCGALKKRWGFVGGKWWDIFVVIFLLSGE